MTKPTKYTTSDTALAAFLAISGVKLVSLNIAVDPAIYTFESNGTLESLIVQWKSELTPFRQYWNTYRSFIKQIKEPNNG